MLIRVLIYNLFVLFRYEILGQKEKTQRLKTLRYKYLVMPAQLGWGWKEATIKDFCLYAETEGKTYLSV